MTGNRWHRRRVSLEFVKLEEEIAEEGASTLVSSENKASANVPLLTCSVCLISCPL